MVSWLTFGSEIWPQTRHSPILTLLFLAASVFAVSSTKKSQRHQPTPSGAETIPSIYSWFELSVGMVSVQGVAGWWHCVWQRNTMSDRLQKGWIGGGYFHLLRAPFSAAIAKKHCPHAPSWSNVAADATQVPYWLLTFAAVAKMSVRCINDASYTKQPNKYY